jgi:hypothetical protein
METRHSTWLRLVLLLNINEQKKYKFTASFGEGFISENSYYLYKNGSI